MSVEAQMGIVSSVIRSETVYDVVSSKIHVTDFTDDKARIVYGCVAGARDMGKPVDNVTLAATLNAMPEWEYGKAEEYLYTLSKNRVGQGFVKTYIGLIKADSVKKKLQDYCEQVGLISENDTLTPEQKIAEAQALMPTMDDDSDVGYVTYYDAAKTAVSRIIDKIDGEITGISSGSKTIDDKTLGFEPGTLTILAGRPSHGKSIHGMDWVHAASEVGHVFVFSLEMTAANLAIRGVSSIGTVDYGVMRSGKLDEHMTSAMQHALVQMKEKPILIDDRGGVSVDQLRSRARMMARKNKPAMVMVDYLTLVDGLGDNRTAQVGYVSRSLKAMAKELHCPVICLAQLNRGVDSRSDHRPTLSDLRDSGEIEQDADIVVFTYLDEKYDDESNRKGIGELIFAKQRNGETGSVFMEWQGRYQRFKEMTGPPPPLEQKEEAKNDRKSRNQIVPSFS